MRRWVAAGLISFWVLGIVCPADARSGTLSADQPDASINIRAFPSLDSRVRESATVGDRVEVLREVTRNGDVWYRIRLADGDQLGWVRADLITLDGEQDARPPSIPAPERELQHDRQRDLQRDPRGPVRLPWRIAQLAAPEFLSHLPLSHLPLLPGASSAPRQADRQQAIDYFLEIAMGSEFGETSAVVKKWAGPIRIAVNGAPTAADLATLDRVIRELNGLIDGAVTLEISDQNPNLEISFLPVSEFSQQGVNYEPGNLGFFWTWWDGDVIDRAKILISTTGVSQKERSHLIREELTQSLGLMKDADEAQYKDSIFYQGWTSTTAYTALDKAIIALLYRPEIRPGMSRAEVELALRSDRTPGRQTATTGWGSAIAADFSL